MLANAAPDGGASDARCGAAIPMAGAGAELDAVARDDAGGGEAGAATARPDSISASLFSSFSIRSRSNRSVSVCGGAAEVRSVEVSKAGVAAELPGFAGVGSVDVSEP